MNIVCMKVALDYNLHVMLRQGYMQIHQLLSVLSTKSLTKPDALIEDIFPKFCTVGLNSRLNDWEVSF